MSKRRSNLAAKVKNTRELIDNGKFRFFGLIYGLPGTGKTTWIGTCDPATTGIAACENGLGSGLLSIADHGFDFFEPENLEDLSKFCRGEIFPDKKVLVLDSISAMARTFIKDAALKIPRARGESDKRKVGIPELDDYGAIAEMTRKAIHMLDVCNRDKHIIVTATEKYDRPNENDPPGTESLIGPELVGQMFLGAPAMFDFVLRLRTRPKLRNAADAKSRYNERYFLTQQESGTIAKCRSNNAKGPLLDKEEIFDKESGKGGFPDLVGKIQRGYDTESERDTSKAA